VFFKGSPGGPRGGGPHNGERSKHHHKKTMRKKKTKNKKKLKIFPHKGASIGDFWGGEAQPRSVRHKKNTGGVGFSK